MAVEAPLPLRGYAAAQEAMIDAPWHSRTPSLLHVMLDEVDEGAGRERESNAAAVVRKRAHGLRGPCSTAAVAVMHVVGAECANAESRQTYGNNGSRSSSPTGCAG